MSETSIYHKSVQCLIKANRTRRTAGFSFCVPLVTSVLDRPRRVELIEMGVLDCVSHTLVPAAFRYTSTRRGIRPKAVGYPPT